MAQTKIRLMTLASDASPGLIYPLAVTDTLLPTNKSNRHTTEAYLDLCRAGNPRFYQSMNFNLDDIVVQYGPWVQKLNETTHGAYVHTPFCFVLTLLDADDEIEGYKRKPGIMFGTTAYQDYYPSGEIVIECLRYRFRGYHKVRVEFLFSVPFSIAGSIEEFLIANLDDSRYECLNYTVYSPPFVDFRKAFKLHDESFEAYSKVFKLFFQQNTSRKQGQVKGSITRYLPAPLESSLLKLLEYYQTEFSLKYAEEINMHSQGLDGSKFSNFATKTPVEKAIWSNLTTRPVLSYTGRIHATNSELVVKSYSFKTRSVLQRSWSDIPDELSNQLFLHPYYVYGGSVYSLSEDVIEELICLENNGAEYDEKIDTVDAKIQRLFMVFGRND